MDHEEIPVPNFDGSHLQRHSVPVISEEEHEIIVLLRSIERKAAVPDDVGDPFMADSVLASRSGEAQRHMPSQEIVSYAVQAVQSGCPLPSEKPPGQIHGIASTADAPGQGTVRVDLLRAFACCAMPNQADTDDSEAA